MPVFCKATIAIIPVVFGTALQASPYYRFYDFIGATGVHGRVLNNSGQVAGYGYQGVFNAFLFTPGVGFSLIGPGNAYGMNNLGQVVGAFSGAGGWGQSYLYTPGTGQQSLLPGSFSSSAWSINDSGQISGVYSTGDGFNHRDFGFLREADGSVLTLPENSFPRVISPSGVVGGSYNVLTPAGRENHGFLYHPSTGFVGLGPSTNEVLGINAAGQAIGRNASPALGPGFLYEPGTGLTYFPELFGFDAYANGINASGQIIGYRFSDNRGFVYTPGSGVVFLDTTIPKSYGISYFQPNAINDLGQILVNERYVLTPSDTPMPDIPEPAALTLTAAGIALIVAGRVRLSRRRLI